MDIQLAKENFTKYLKGGNFRITPERFIILDAVMNIDGHFDADELFFQMKTSGQKVSRATVYNTLDLLQDCGLISKYRFGENHSKYEKAFGRPQHHHLICLECGDIIEFVNDRIEKIQKDVCDQNSFKSQTSTLQIFGICSKCQK
ncbi:MAG: Fur family transcriptional regulator [Bacteroidota bacterium]|nr:Fur family transcriptional regulator [Bacteroidota bacterium]